jgi:hypothetical protein
MLYALCFLLFMIGLYCAVVKKNLVKIVIGLAIMEYAVNLFLIMLGYVDGTGPILGRQTSGRLSASRAFHQCASTTAPFCADCRDQPGSLAAGSRYASGSTTSTARSTSRKSGG